MRERSISFALCCEASALRGELRHSYLENTFLSLSHPADLTDALSREDDGEDALSRFSGRLAHLVEQLEDLRQGFSPVLALDSCGPLKELREEAGARLADAMVRHYEARFRPRERASRIVGAGRKLDLACRDFLARSAGATSGKPDPDPGVLIGKVRESAGVLYDELDALPKGVWLWPGKDEKGGGA